MKHRNRILLTITVLVAGCSLGQVPGPTDTVAPGQAGGKADTPWSPKQQTYDDYYLDKIQPVLDGRCVVCHSCYNAPCQLKLSSYDGVARGASQKQLYDSSRLTSMAPTRLFIDAQTPEQWRKRGFFPVVHHHAENAALNIESSLMYKMLASGKDYKEANPFDEDQPTTFSGNAEQSRNCPSNEAEFEDFIYENPNMGMPFGCPEIGKESYETIVEWIKQGAPGPSPEARARLEAPSTGESGLAVLKKWEDFFNGQSAKQRLTARYLYEHLFLAHLYFDEIPGDYYRLVRSRTAHPQPVVEINSVRPYDDPLEPFSYRLRKITSTIVHKTHILYHLTNDKMERFRQLFLDSDWGTDPVVVPDYERGANPFVTFAQIPARARYQFMLDNARYTIMTFIRGPVCRGQSALNVIRDHFMVLFMDPDSDPSVTDPAFFAQTGEALEMPIRGGSNPLTSIYSYYKLKQRSYIADRNGFYAEHFPNGLALGDIWDGDGHRPAILTIYRHFDSGTVLEGAIGGVPKTMLLLDYPILERIYYDLVAGFNVFGNAFHQLAVRMYMDDLRVEGEDNFLNLLPASQREDLRDHWNQGVLAQVEMFKSHPFWGGDRPTQISFTPGKDPVQDLLEQVLFGHLTEAARGELDFINGLAVPSADKLPMPHETISSEVQLDEALRTLTTRYGEFTQLLPEVSLLRITHTGGEDLIYTILHNRDHLNVLFINLEENYLNPEKDTLNVVKGFVGSYPNFFFVVPMNKTAAFINDMLNLKQGDGSLRDLVSQYGIRRTNPALWSTLDWFHQTFFDTQPTEAGLLDINRYQNL